MKKLFLAFYLCLFGITFVSATELEQPKTAELVAVDCADFADTFVALMEEVLTDCTTDDEHNEMWTVAHDECERINGQ